MRKDRPGLTRNENYRRILEALADRELPAEIGRLVGFMVKDGYAEYMRDYPYGPATGVKITASGLALLEQFIADDQQREEAGAEVATDEADVIYLPTKHA